MRYAASANDHMKWRRTQAQLRWTFAVYDDLEIDVVGYRHDLDRTWNKVNGLRGAPALHDVLTYAGTMAQEHLSVFDAQRQYFESLFVRWDTGIPLFGWKSNGSPLTIVVPLPGGYTLLVALFFSFAVEPAVNWLARRGWRRGSAMAARRRRWRMAPSVSRSRIWPRR